MDHATSVPYCVCTVGRIADSEALQFAQGFYEHLSHTASGKGAAGSGLKGRPPTFPPAPEIVKGSRVEMTWDHAWHEAVVLTMGARDRDGQVRPAAASNACRVPCDDRRALTP